MLVISLPQFSRAASTSHVLLSDLVARCVSLSLCHFTTQDFALFLSTDLLHRRRSRRSPRTGSHPRRNTRGPVAWLSASALRWSESTKILPKAEIIIVPENIRSIKAVQALKKKQTIFRLFAYVIVLWKRQGVRQRNLDLQL